MGGDGVHAHRHRLDAAVGQDLRPLRPAAAVPDRDRHLRRGLPARRLLAEHRAADRVPRGPGPRRRRADVARAGDDRRHHPAARARSLPGLLRRRLRHVVGARPGPRRLVRRRTRLAVDLLHERPDRPRRTGDHLRGAEDAARTPRPLASTTSAPPLVVALGVLVPALHRLGRARPRLGLRHRCRPARRRGRAGGRLRARRAARHASRSCRCGCSATRSSRSRTSSGS